VMESTAQYWKPVWLALEGSFRLHLAQARSNLAPRGRKTDFRDAERMVRRLLSGDLALSFVPSAEQCQWRLLASGKYQLRRDRVRLQNQLEGLLEEGRIKLSSVVADLLGLSSLRILRALAAGENDAVQLAALADNRLRVSREDLAEALRGSLTRIQRLLLNQFLTRLDAIDGQIRELDQTLAEEMEQYSDAIHRLSQIPGDGTRRGGADCRRNWTEGRRFRRSREAGQLGGRMSGTAGKRRTVDQQPLSQGQPTDAANPDRSGLRCRQDQRQPLSGSISKAGSPFGR